MFLVCKVVSGGSVIEPDSKSIFSEELIVCLKFCNKIDPYNIEITDMTNKALSNVQ